MSDQSVSQDEQHAALISALGKIVAALEEIAISVDRLADVAEEQESRLTDQPRPTPFPADRPTEDTPDE